MAWTSPKTWTAEVLTSADLNQYVRDNQNYLKTNAAWGAAVELTLSTGAVTRTQTFHEIDTEGDTVSDDLDTINGGSEGEVIVFHIVDADRKVTVRNGTGNIVLVSDLLLSDPSEMLALIYDGTNWQVLNYPISDVMPLPFCVTNAGYYTGFCKTFED